MGAEDVERQRLNVFRMEMMGATVQQLKQGLVPSKMLLMQPLEHG